VTELIEDVTVLCICGYEFTLPCYWGCVKEMAGTLELSDATVKWRDYVYKTETFLISSLSLPNSQVEMGVKGSLV
jgi:hypothetical protein